MRRFGIIALLSIFLALPLAAQTATYSITINPGITFNPAGGPLAQGVINTSYSASVTLAGGITPYAAAITSGSLPAGITMALSGSTITFSGTPTATGTSNFTVTITGANGSAKTEMKVDMQVASTIPMRQCNSGELMIAQENADKQIGHHAEIVKCMVPSEETYMPPMPVLGYREPPKLPIAYSQPCPIGFTEWQCRYMTLVEIEIDNCLAGTRCILG
jgi:hypothetical protein